MSAIKTKMVDAADLTVRDQMVMPTGATDPVRSIARHDPASGRLIVLTGRTNGLLSWTFEATEQVKILARDW